MSLRGEARKEHGHVGWRIFTLELRRRQPDLVTELLQEAS